MKSTRLLFIALTLLLVQSNLGASDLQVTRTIDDAAAMTGLLPLPLDAVVPAAELESLAEANIEAETIGAYRIAGPEDITVATFREASGATLFLYKFRELDAEVFVRVSESPSGQRELRIWSDGPSEIVITPEGMQLLETSSADTFRFRRVATNALSIPDIISCLARGIGISFNPSTLTSRIASTACSATSSLALVLTATNCLSIPSLGSATVFATIGCVNGIAKLIACSIARCSRCDLTSIRAGGTEFGTFGEPCRSEKTPSSYAKFYMFSITKRTKVDILASSRNAAPILYLREGGLTTSPVIASDSNSTNRSDARINVTLAPGKYVIEVVSKGTEDEGTFTLVVR